MSSQNVVAQIIKAKEALPVIRKGDRIGPGSLHCQAMNQVLSMLQDCEEVISRAPITVVAGRKTVPGKTSIVTSVNIASSLVDGMDDNEVSEAEVKEALQSLSSHLDTCMASLANAAKATEKATVTEEAVSLETASPQAQLFGKMQKYADSLPKDGKKEKEPFVLRRVPVTPVFEGGASAEDLSKIGFKTINSVSFFMKRSTGSGGGDSATYNVIADQLVVGINLSKEEHPGGLAHYAEELADLAGRKLGERLAVMGSDLTLGGGRSTTASKGYVYFWLVPHTLLNRMNRVMGSTELADWGFPFK